MSERGDWSYIGIDESNHGRFPEVFVAVFSNKEGDAMVSSEPRIPKKRRGHPNLQRRLRERHYSFLLLTEQDEDPLERDKVFGLVVANLLHGVSLQDQVSLYIDGELPEQRVAYVEKALVDGLGYSTRDIKIEQGKDLDRRVEIVNVADETAHWLYKKTLKKLSDHPNFTPFRRDLLK